MMNETTNATVTGPWRCFYCDVVFEDFEAAQAHFGNFRYSVSACAIDLANYWELEAEVASLRTALEYESAEGLRMYRQLQAEVAQKLRRAEEIGYARGLRDAYKTQ